MFAHTLSETPKVCKRQLRRLQTLGGFPCEFTSEGGRLPPNLFREGVSPSRTAHVTSCHVNGLHLESRFRKAGYLIHGQTVAYAKLSKPSNDTLRIVALSSPFARDINYMWESMKNEHPHCGVHGPPNVVLC